MYIRIYLVEWLPELAWFKHTVICEMDEAKLLNWHFMQFSVGVVALVLVCRVFKCKLTQFQFIIDLLAAKK